MTHPFFLRRLALGAAPLLLLGGCVAPIGPVEVTRFHSPDLAALGHGAVAVVPAPGNDGGSLEWQSYQSAVMRQLALLGYGEATPGAANQLAELRLVRTTLDPARGGGPVSVGVGGQTGSYGSGVGLGVGVNLSPRPSRQVSTELAVTLRDRVSGRALWEGRASFTVPATSPLAASSLGAAKMTEALFGGFPGPSGQTVEVK